MANNTKNKCSDDPLLQSLLKNQKIYLENPSDPEILLELSTEYQAIGLFKLALDYAKKAEKISPDSGDVFTAKIHALYLLNQKDTATNLVLSNYFSTNYEYSGHMKGWLRHSLLGMLLETNKLEEAEKFILNLHPNVLQLMDKKVIPGSLNFGIPLHTLEPLIYIYRKTNRTQEAAKLARHLAGFSAESFFETTTDKLVGPQHWFLASIWAGVPENNIKIITSLTKAYQSGFNSDWRFNYAHHPVYWPLHSDDNFKKLINNIESEMAISRNCYLTSGG